MNKGFVKCLCGVAILMVGGLFLHCGGSSAQTSGDSRELEVDVGSPVDTVTTEDLVSEALQDAFRDAKVVTRDLGDSSFGPERGVTTEEDVRIAPSRDVTYVHRDMIQEFPKRDL